MRGFMLISLVSLAFGAPQSLSEPFRFNQAHLEYGPPPISTTNVLSQAHLEYGPPPVSFTNVLNQEYGPPSVSTTNVLNQEYEPSFISSTNFLNLAHLEYGPPVESTTNFLTDLKMAMDFQATNFETSNFLTDSFQQTSANIDGVQNLPQQIPYETTNFQFNSNRNVIAPIISKRFFLHSAPEDEDDIVEPKTITIGKPHKNYHVVFIKAPAKIAQRSTIKIIPAQNEDRTIIYLLSKKHDLTEINAQIQEPLTTTTKPEVFFIKYKTKEEAEHAQNVIQSQFDALGGSTQITDEGVAPVASVVGQLTEEEAERTITATSDKILTSTNFNNIIREHQTPQEFMQVHQLEENLNQDHELEDNLDNNTNNGYLPPDKKY